MRVLIIAKLIDGSLREGANAADAIREGSIGAWNDLKETNPQVFIEGISSSYPEGHRIFSLSDKARNLDDRYRPPDWRLYFEVRVQVEETPDWISRRNHFVEQLGSWEEVIFAYISPDKVPFAFAGNPLADGANFLLLTDIPLHLADSPDGIGAEHAWKVQGGRGRDQRLVDIESGWTSNHLGLQNHKIYLVSGLNDGDLQHGTAMLGIVATQSINGASHPMGVAPQIGSIGMSSPSRRGDPHYRIDRAIISAILGMSPGDILLIEEQTELTLPSGYGYSQIPVEIFPWIFVLIELAVCMGIVVIEPAGNGGIDLAKIVDSGGNRLFDRAARDSGAIIVAAATFASPHQPKSTCYDDGIDCYAWGESVETTWTDPQGIANNQIKWAGGTSSASAMVAGAAIVIQGIRAAKGEKKLGPDAMRKLLAQNGTSSQNPAVDRIGVMPDLGKIVKSL